MSDFELMNTPEKIQYLYEKLNKIKPECFKEEADQPLGDFWVNLKDAKKYNWLEYAFDDFLIAFLYTDPNKATRSCNTDDLTLGYPNTDDHTSFDKVDSWKFGATRKAPDFFTQENLDNDCLWVKPVVVHKKKSAD